MTDGAVRSAVGRRGCADAMRSGVMLDHGRTAGVIVASTRRVQKLRRHRHGRQQRDGDDDDREAEAPKDQAHQYESKQ